MARRMHGQRPEGAYWSLGAFRQLLPLGFARGRDRDLLLEDVRAKPPQQGYKSAKSNGLIVYPGIRVRDHRETTQPRRWKVGRVLEHQSQITFRLAIMPRPSPGHLPEATSRDNYTAG